MTTLPRSSMFLQAYMLIVIRLLQCRNAAAWTTAPRLQAKTLRSIRNTPSARFMGLLDSISDFIQDRQGDFTKLDSGGEVFGPGPAILLYGVPAGVTDDEIQDMLQDAAPVAHSKGCRLCRVTDDMLDQSLQDALEKVAAGKMQSSPHHVTIAPLTTAMAIPVLFFSGFQNGEMRSLYDILGKEIYEETAGQASAACAMAVPNAMQKNCLQVLQEIAGDHEEAMNMAN
jgi:hypothetical protein